MTAIRTGRDLSIRWEVVGITAVLAVMVFVIHWLAGNPLAPSSRRR